MSKLKLPKTWAGMQRKMKRIREQRAVCAIIAGCMRGFDDKDWKRVFAKVDELEKKRKRDQQHMEKHQGDIY